MKRSFVEVADSPYQLKKMIEESLKIKAAGILSNPDFQQAAALGLLEFQDNDDQLTPNLTPDDLLKFFSQVVSYHDNEHPQGTLKRISSKTDTHSEEPNEDLESAYKKLFGTSIDKDPAFKHFFESEQLSESFYKFVNVTSDDPKVHDHLQGSVKVNGRKRETTVVPGKKTTKIGMSGSEEGTAKAISDHLKSKGFVEGTHYTIKKGLSDSFKETYKNFIAEYEAALEENGIYEYDLDEATEFFIENMYGIGNPTGRLAAGERKPLVQTTDPNLRGQRPATQPGKFPQRTKPLLKGARP